MTTFTEPDEAGQGPHEAGQGQDQGQAPQPRALIVTIYGLYARETRGWLSVASLIRLMAGLGMDEPAVRSSISRLKRRGILVPWRPGAVAGYELSEAGRLALAEGDRRIFGRPRALLSDGWLLAVFSVPESQRQQRHELRSRLTWLGFGTVSAGVWIAPGHLAGETDEVLRRSGLAGYVQLFRAEYLAFGEVAGQIGQWWDLDRLQRLYQEFLDSYGPLSHQRPASDGAAFGAYVRALTDWRRLPFLDPGLPAELLPPQWHGQQAAELFDGIRAQLEEPARRHVHAVTGEPAPGELTE